MSHDARGETGGGSEWARTSARSKIASKGERTDGTTRSFRLFAENKTEMKPTLEYLPFWIVHASRVRFIGLKFSEVGFSDYAFVRARNRDVATFF